MIFLPVNESNKEILQAFLEPYESSCASLCSRVRKGEDCLFAVLKSGCGNELKSVENLFGAVYVNYSVLHCLPFLKEENLEFEKAFLEFTEGRNIRCIDGEEKGSLILKKILQKKNMEPSTANEYFLMTKEDDSLLPPPASLLSMGEEIVCCKTGHEEDLFELQKSYLKEEVAAGINEPSDLYVRSNLKMLLKTQKLFAIESDGQFVAKANTNAIGWNWVQIGGVYTHCMYRRMGYGLCLMSTLCRRIIKTGRKICLFVKKKNLPALNLYEKLGFKKSCSFVILYYK